MCSLHGAVAAQYNLSWHAEVTNIFGPEDCSIAIFTVVQFTTLSIIQLLHYYLEYFYRPLWFFYQQLRLTSNDIVLFNRGFHVREENIMQQEVKSFFNEYLKLPESHQPMLIWRESSPQHFDTPNGYYDRGRLHFPCHPYNNVAKAYAENFHNRFVDQMFTYYRHIPIMRVWNVSSMAGE